MHPVLFTFPLTGKPVYAYGTMLYLSFVAGWRLVLHLGAADGLPQRAMKQCFLVTAVAALAGSRLLYVVTDPGAFHSLIDVLRIDQGGIVAYGGFLGGLVGSSVYCRLQRISLLTWADCAVAALCTGLALTRVGCFLAGCDFGKPWDGAWAVSFPAGSFAFRQQVADGLLPATAAGSLRVHPTQLYESLAGLVLLALVLWARPRRRAHGEALAAFAMGYAVLRYGLETLRADADRGFVGPFSTSQLIALVTCAAGLTLFAWLRSRATQAVLSNTPA